MFQIDRYCFMWLCHCVVVFQIDRYCFMADLLISSHKPLLITGDPGVGKTSLIEVRLHAVLSSTCACTCTCHCFVLVSHYYRANYFDSQPSKCTMYQHLSQYR